MNESCTPSSEANVAAAAAPTAPDALPPVCRVVAPEVPPLVCRVVAPEARPPRLRAGRALLILLGFIVVQLLAGFGVVLVAMAGAAVSGSPLRTPGALEACAQRMLLPAVLVSLLGGGVAIVVLARLLLGRDEIADGSPAGAAWRVGAPRKIGLGLVLGLAIGLLYLLPSVVLGPLSDEHETGPLARMAMTPGLTQGVWVLVALVLAPPVEELLFRGVLYGGFRTSLGPAWAAVLSTLIFWLLHITETIYFWPSMIAIALFAVAALWIRLHARAIGPAVAVHFGYNAVLVMAALTATT